MIRKLNYYYNHFLKFHIGIWKIESIWVHSERLLTCFIFVWLILDKTKLQSTTNVAKLPHQIYFNLWFFNICLSWIQLLAPQADQTKDGKLLWDLLKKKQTCQQPESPFGPKELLPVGISTRRLRSTMAKPSITHRPTTRSYGNLKTPSLDSLLPLGSSPSVTTRQVILRRR